MRAKAILAKGSFVVGLLVLLGGCSTTPEALEAKSEAVSQNYAENYEEVYRRLTNTARRCLATQSINAVRLEVETDLHKERDFANIRFVAAGLYSNYFTSTKVEKIGSGSRVSVRSGSPITSDKFYKMIFRWAGGDQECFN
jgi:hypothetical protein